jgi:hypothetical protein
LPWFLLLRALALLLLLAAGPSAILASNDPKPAPGAGPGSTAPTAVSESHGPAAELGDGVVFDHKKHVSPYWSSRAAVDKKLALREGEVARDCRGCHDYRKDVPPAQLARPIDRCDRCHDPDGYFRETNGQRLDTSKSRVQPADEADRLFKHGDHLVHRESGEPLDCAECHYKDTGTRNRPAWEIRLPTDNLEGKAYCVKCHDDSSPAVRRSFNRGLTEQAKEASDARGPAVFSHAAHLSEAELASGNQDACRTCHSRLAEGRPDSLAEPQFDTEACAKCHVGMQFEASRKGPDGSAFRRTSPTRGVFSHAQHQAAGPPPAAVPHPRVPKTASDKLAREGCLACHVFEGATPSPTPKAVANVRGFGLREFLEPADQRGSYGGCVTCHTEMAVQNHGDTDECARCHAIQPSSLTTHHAMADNRPREPITRVDPETFTFERQSHKFISKGREADAPENCADCHRAKLGEQPSHIVARAFDHATHVQMGLVARTAKDPNAVCLKCHSAVARSAELGSLAATFDASGCVECHGERAPTAVPSATPRTSAHRFDHARHVGKNNGKGAPITCADCHLSEPAPAAAGAAAAPARIVLADKIAECTGCHGHGEVAEAPRNRFAAATVASCARCHAAGVPAKGQAVEVERARLAFGGGYQRHEGEAKCTTCHQVMPQAFPLGSAPATDPEPIAISIVATSGRLVTPHDGRRAKNKASKGTPQELELIQYFYDDIACIECHWHDVTPCDENAALNAARQTKNAAVKQLLSNPKWRDEYRAAFGNDLGGPQSINPGGFPGFGPPLTR